MPLTPLFKGLDIPTKVDGLLLVYGSSFGQMPFLSAPVTHMGTAPCGLRGCKNGPTPFPGQMSYKATKPGLVCLSYLSMLYYCIVVY